MLQSVHAGCEQTGVLELGGQKIDGHRKLGCRQDFVAAMMEQVLKRDVVSQPLPENLEQVRLFDVLFSRQRAGHAISFQQPERPTP